MENDNLISRAVVAARGLRTDGATARDTELARLLERVAEVMRDIAAVEFEGGYSFPFATGYDGVPLDRNDTELDQEDAARAMNAIQYAQECIAGIGHCGDCAHYEKDCDANLDEDSVACDKFIEKPERPERERGAAV